MNEGRNDGMTIDDNNAAMGGFGAVGGEQVQKVQYICGRK